MVLAGIAQRSGVGGYIFLSGVFWGRRRQNTRISAKESATYRPDCFTQVPSQEQDRSGHSEFRRHGKFVRSRRRKQQLSICDARNRIADS